MSRILEDNSTESWTYTYDANGMRLSRSSGTDADDVTYTYVYTDGLLTRMTIGDMMLYFTYDAADTPMTMSIHTGSNCAIGSETGCGADCATYYYVTNLQGDVIAILDDSGTAITLYQYDAWGYPTLTLDVSDDDIGTLNPLRYRGYVYDKETGLYYLQSRYYNPQIGRFISSDVLLSTGQGILGNNMFAYCLNNPVRYSDPTGESATIAGAIIGGLFGAINGLISGDSWKDVLACAAVGAATGALAGFVADVSIASFGVGGAILASAIAGGICSGANSVATQCIINDGKIETIDWYKVGFDTIIGAAAGGTCTAMSSLGGFQSLGIKAGIRFAKATVAAEEFMFMSQAYIGSALWFDIGATAVTTFGAWTAGVVYDYYHAILEVI